MKRKRLLGRKIVSYLLTVVMVLAMLPVGSTNAYALPESGQESNVIVTTIAEENASIENANTSRNLVVGKDGTIHVVYLNTSDRYIKYVKSTDKGITFSEPVNVAIGNECEIAVSSNGRVFVSYNSDSVYIAYSDDGTEFTPVKLDAGELTSCHIATDGDYVYGINQSGSEFYYSSDNGETYSKHSNWDHYVYSDVLVDTSNHKVIVMKDQPSVVCRVSSDYGETFTDETSVMYDNSQIAIYNSCATIGNGYIYMTGTENTIYKIDYNNATAVPTDIVETNSRSVSADDNNNVIVGVVNYTGNGNEVSFQLSTDGGETFSEQVSLGEADAANAAINSVDGTVLFLYVDNYGKLKLYSNPDVLESIKYTASGYNGKYDGSAHGINVTVTEPESGATVKYGTTEGVYTLDSSPTITNVSDSPLTVYYEITADDYSTVTGSENVIINKADITPVVSIENWTYGGTASTPSVSGNTGNGTVTYTYSESENGTYISTIPTNAGTYYIKANVAETANYNAAESAPVSFTIAPGTITPTVNITGWTYGETASTPSVSGNTGNGTVTCTYSESENGTYTSTVPTNAGTYYIKANVAATDNYNAATSAPVAFVIAPKSLTDAMLTIPTSTFVHDGNTKTPSYTVKDGTTTLTEGMDYTVDIISTTSSNAYGIHTIKVNGTGNYTGTATKIWSITDETAPSATISIENNSFTSMLNAITFGLFFNKTETVNITATDAGSGVSKIEYVTTDTVATSKDAIDELTGWTTVNGSTASFSKNPETKFIVYAKVTDNDGNVAYISSQGVVLDTTLPVVTVDGAAPKTSYNKAVSWSATDANLKKVTVDFTAEGSEEAQTVYSQNATETIVNSEVKLSDLGTYKITATDKAGNITEKTFAIVRRDAVITGKNETTTYDAEETYDVSNLFTFEDGLGVKVYTIVANEDTQAVAGTGIIEGNALTITKAGIITVKATVLDCTTNTTTPEFIKETTVTATLLVNKAAGNAYISIADVVYGNSITVTTDSTNTGVDGTVTYTLIADSDGTEIAEESQTATATKPTDAGTYKAEVVYHANDLYKEAKAGIMFKIAKAEPTVTAPEANDITYTGEAQTLVTKAVTEDGTVSYSLDNETYTEAVPSGVDAGEYTVYYKVTGDENHKDSEPATVKAVIKKAATDDITLEEDIEVISAGVKDETLDLTKYLKEGYKVVNADITGELAEYISAKDLGDGTFAYSVSENKGGIKGSVVLTIGSTNYKDYTITINVVSKKRITEVVVETDDVEETDVKDVTVPELEEYTESQPETAVEVTMEVNVVSEDTVKKEEGEKVLAEIKKLIENSFDGMESKDLKQEFLDINVLKSVNGGKPEEVKELNRVVDIVLKYDMTGKFNPFVIRAHDGKTAKLRRLSAMPLAGKFEEGTFFITGKGADAVIHIFSSRFSTYTLAYSTTASYQVTFDDMQNNINQVAVAEGSKVSKPADPTRDGYTFEGWYVEGSTDKYDFDKAVSGDLTLIAKWKEVEKPAATPAPTPAPTKTPEKTATPKTGDSNNYYGYWMLLASAGFVASYMALKRSRKEI